MKAKKAFDEILKAYLDNYGDKKEGIRVLEQYVKEQLIKDREKLFREIAEQLWEVNESIYSENEERDYAIGYDENGIPNSVSLEIYGRTHSELSFASPEIK